MGKISTLVIAAAIAVIAAACGDNAAPPTDTPNDSAGEQARRSIADGETQEDPFASLPPGQAPDCEEEPLFELVSTTGRVAMDLVYYQEMTATCGLNVDGEWLFDDVFRPATALHVPGGEFAIAADPGGEVSVDIRPLEPGLRLARINPGPDVLAAAADGTYPVSLPGDGCFAVTVGWQLDGRDGKFTGLAESTSGACDVD